MSLTVTTVVPVSAVGPGLLRGVYSIAWDSSYSAGGEVWAACVDDFDYVFGGSIISNDTLADNGYKFGMIVPASGTAASASNVLFDCHWEKNPADAGGADIAFPEFSGNLSSVGAMKVVVWGA
jgi:hypothetical protein